MYQETDLYLEMVTKAKRAVMAREVLVPSFYSRYGSKIEKYQIPSNGNETKWIDWIRDRNFKRPPDEYLLVVEGFSVVFNFMNFQEDDRAEVGLSMILGAMRYADQKCDHVMALCITHKLAPRKEESGIIMLAKTALGKELETLIIPNVPMHTCSELEKPK